jgi:endonuclease YncB( thermonuclease family)
MKAVREAELIHLRFSKCGAGAAMLVAGLLGGIAHAGEPGCLEGTEEVRAAEVVDARALRLEDGRVLRIAGIEPFDLLRPELRDAEAVLRRRLAALAGEGPLSVQLAADAPDRYGRLPALVSAGGTTVQESLVGEGLAVAFAGGDPLPCFQRILAAEDAARRAGRGFWAGVTLPVATPAALRQQIGHFVIFRGTVISVGNRSARTYLNFGNRWSEDVTVEIEAANRGDFGGETGLAALAGRQVQARGYLEEKAGPMLAMGSPMQLEVIGPIVGE